jgi:hypothetical protein
MAWVSLNDARRGRGEFGQRQAKSVHACVRWGLPGRINSVSYRPLIVSARAFSQELPAAPSDGWIPASARRSLNRIDVYCDPRSVWWTTSFRSKKPSCWRLRIWVPGRPRATTSSRLFRQEHPGPEPRPDSAHPTWSRLAARALQGHFRVSWSYLRCRPVARAAPEPW